MGYPKALRRLGGQVYMPPGHDDALAQLYRAPGAKQQRPGGAPNVAGEAHRGGEPQLAAVRQGNFHLPRLSLRPQHGHVLEFSFWPLHRHPLPGQELPGLAQGPLRR